MAVRGIIKLPDPILRLVSKPVKAVTAETRALMDDMLETMYEAPGIGLAAVQLGMALRVVTIDLAKEGEETRVNDAGAEGEPAAVAAAAVRWVVAS